MDHASQVKIVPEAKSAVLFIHGICGSPRHFSDVLPMVQAVPEGWSYHNLLLRGHGGSVREFSRATMKQWKTQVWDAFNRLAAEHQRVAIVGHSMGTLFALQLAVEFHEKIPFLFLIASPIRPWVSLRGIGCCMRACFGKARTDHPVEMAIVEAGGIALTGKLWQYIPWAPNMIALLLEAVKTEKLLPKVKTNTVVFQSRHDEMVSRCSGVILQKCPCATVCTLEGSTHFYYPEAEAARIVSAFSEMLQS